VVGAPRRGRGNPGPGDGLEPEALVEGNCIVARVSPQEDDAVAPQPFDRLPQDRCPCARALQRWNSPPVVESEGDELSYPQFFQAIALWAWIVLAMCVVCGVAAVLILGTAWAVAGPLMMGAFALGVPLATQPRK
jgi:hypothetical protein